MELETKIASNWVLEKGNTDIPFDENIEFLALTRLRNEIIHKVKELDQRVESKEVPDKKIDLQSLPLYLAKQFSINSALSNLSHTYCTQTWRGHIIELNEKEFVAKLEDLTNPSTFEILTIAIEEVVDEIDLVKLGAVFYLSVGYDVNRGQRRKQSIIRFQRLTEWTCNDLNKVLKRSDELLSTIKFE